MSASRKRKLRLEDQKKTNRDALISFKKFVYSKDISLGDGSFGKVYLGWTKDGKDHIAVKVIEKSLLKKDPKLKENLEREIAILKLLSHCENVVQILDAQESRHGIFIAMEMCDLDLDKLVKENPLHEKEVVTFMNELAEGMKALRSKNIVHRDLKPGNILISVNPTTGKKTFKLADFGFARRFTDDANRKISMQSLAGTPVYMAPEALSCVFYAGNHYDDKVDIWSIGALLYKVIVGECGFFAHLDKILEHLRHKKDAIAFEVSKTAKVKYIEELPSSVKLTEPFRTKMNNVLQHMLKFDPRDRMSFPVFFEIVDDIITSKIEIVNLLHGTSFKIEADSALNADTLVEKVQGAWQLTPDCHIIFSPSCPHYITSRKPISKEQFDELLSKSGGSYGHAKLYVFEMCEKEELVPDVSCLEHLKFAIEEGNISKLIAEQQFCDEIVYMIERLRIQLKTQLEGLERLAQFTVQEVGLSQEYCGLVEKVHQTLAKVSLTQDWLQREMGIFGAALADQGPQLLQKLNERRKELENLAVELRTRSIPTLSSSFSHREHIQKLSDYKEYAKRLSRTQKDSIPGKCQELYDRCTKELKSATAGTREQLVPFREALAGMRGLYTTSAQVLDVAQLLEEVERERQRVLMEYAGVPNGAASISAAPATPTHQDPAHPSPQPPHKEASSPVRIITEENNTIVEGLREEVKKLQSQLATEQEAHKTDRKRLQEVLDSGASGNDLMAPSTPPEERTIRTEVGSAERTIRTTPSGNRLFPGTSAEEIGELSELTQQLKAFCLEAQRISMPVPGANFYTELVDAGKEFEEYDVQQLLSAAQRLSDSLQTNIPSIKALVATKEDEGLLLRIGVPTDYQSGDVAAFVPFKDTRGITMPVVLQLGPTPPCMFMDVNSFKDCKIKPGKIPELFFARITETPRPMKLENHKLMAKNIGRSEGDFYRVKVKPVDIKLTGNCPFLLQK